MVGIVIVSHSCKLAEGLLHELRMFSKECPISIAGGNDDNDYGTSASKIKKAIQEVYSLDGVCIIADVGSSIMTSEMVIEELGDDNIKILNCSFLEGTISAVSLSSQKKTITEITNTINK